ncbi:MAG: hypothetical protein LBO79_08805 [Zoogloeaceae bacterium]|jgi:hypothetical protein|nr:hypothetical protein [Zoogloeaceae bacterium]
MFRKFRIAALLLILLVVAVGAWKAKVRITSWERTVYVAIYPIVADSALETAQFVRALKTEDFSSIEIWVQREFQRYGIPLQHPVRILLAPETRGKPPAPPMRGSMSRIILWSLKMRWWAFRHDDMGPNNTIRNPQVRMFVLFHAPTPGKLLPHSTGLKEGRIGIVHAFAHAGQGGQNSVVIAHELLHTFGATDKYDFSTLQPYHPEGYADPGQRPLLPQTRAEIMAGRIPKRPDYAEMPMGLAETIIGAATAAEIGLAPR